MGNQAGGSSKQRGMPQPQGMVGSMNHFRGDGGSYGGGGGAKGPSGSKSQRMPDPRRPPGDVGGPPGAANSEMPDYEAGGAGMQNPAQTNAQSGGALNPDQMQALMTGLSAGQTSAFDAATPGMDQAQRNQYINQYGPGGTDSKVFNDWYAGNKQYAGSGAATPAPGAAPATTTDPATAALPPRNMRKPMQQQRSMRRAQGSGGNIQQMLARLMGGGY
jgi:hypothetical protein